MKALPSGTVTMLFTDVEGSTRLLQELGRDEYVRCLEAHRRTLRETARAHDGVEVEMQGDSFHFAFASARAGVLAAADAQRALHATGDHGPIRVRIGVHTGEPVVTDDLYAGLDVHRAARVMAAGHGGQVLVSAATQAATASDLPDDVAYADLGEHRLKDLPEPHRLFQLLVAGLPNEFPPLKTRSPKTRLPIPPNALVGRDRELREVVELVLDRGARLVTLVGPGGSGKTRLAVDAAARLADSCRDGVWFVGLAPLRDAALVLPLVLRTLGEREEPGQTAAETLVERVGDREILLLLDNVEQVADAAVDLPRVLAACAGLRVLATSRQPLQVTGETTYAVAPLPLDDATMLFAERAGDAALDHETVAAICARVDGLPLAVELAAARAAVLSPKALLARLDRSLGLLTGGPRDADERQRTLRATIDWSYDLLEPDEQRAFRRLAVFVGGARLDAVEDVVGADALDLVTSLVGKNLVRRGDDPDGEPRYWMLETIREYASELLASTADAEDVRRLHLEHFARVADAVEALLRSPDEPEALDRLERDHENVRAGLEFAVESNDVQRAFRLPIAVNRLWLLRGYLGEGSRAIEAVLELGGPPNLRAAVLRKLATLCLEQGLLDRAGEAAGEALELNEGAGDAQGAAQSAALVADVAAYRGDLDTAGAMYTEAARQARLFDDDLELALALYNGAQVRRLQDDREASEALFRDAFEVFARLRDPVGQGGTLIAIGSMASEAGDLDRALELVREGAEHLRSVGYVGGLVDVLDVSADVAARAGDPARAARLWAAQHAAAAEIGRLDRHPAEAALHEAALAGVREALGDEEFEAAWSAGASLSLDEAIDEVVGRPVAEPQKTR
jgi:predicted ATPase/class 3 adenylate cyclase